MDNKRGIRLNYLSPGLPYLMLLFGLHMLHSAWIASIFCHLSIVLVLLIKKQSESFRGIFRGFSMASAIIYIIIGAFAGPAIILFWSRMKFSGPVIGDTLAAIGLHGWAWYLFIPYYVFVNAFIEEVFWRDYVNPESLLLSWIDLVFAGYHILVLILFIKFPWVIVSFVVLALASWAWRRAAIRYKGLAIPFLSHIAASLSVAIAVNSLVS
jgi:hypothetical protein